MSSPMISSAAARVAVASLTLIAYSMVVLLPAFLVWLAVQRLEQLTTVLP